MRQYDNKNVSIALPGETIHFQVNVWLDRNLTKIDSINYFITLGLLIDVRE